MSVIEEALVKEGERIAGEALPMIVQWVIGRLRDGSDASADLRAKFDAGDIVADEAERAKFGG